LTGPYIGALLRFGLHFSSEYPFELPIVVFEHGIFHPLVIGEKAQLNDDVFVDISKRHASGTGEMIGHFNLKSGFKDITIDGSSERCRFNIIDILLYIRSCFNDRRTINNLELQDIANMTAWQAWQNHNEFPKDENDQENSEKDIWQQEIDNLLERSSNVKPEDLFEEVKRNNHSPNEQLGRNHSLEADC